MPRHCAWVGGMLVLDVEESQVEVGAVAVVTAAAVFLNFNSVNGVDAARSVVK